MKARGTRHALDHFDHLLPIDLLIALHVSVLDKPAFEFRITPRGPDVIGDAVIVVFHVLGEGRTFGVVGV
jgi:hypothetical protein